MFSRLKRSWHKAQALSAIQVYIELPLKEPLPTPIDAELKRLSELGVSEGITPIDTAYRYYIGMLRRHLDDGGTLEAVNFMTALGRLSALKEKAKCHREHHDALMKIGRSVGEAK